MTRLPPPFGGRRFVRRRPPRWGGGGGSQQAGVRVCQGGLAPTATRKAASIIKAAPSNQRSRFDLALLYTGMAFGMAIPPCPGVPPPFAWGVKPPILAAPNSGGALISSRRTDNTGLGGEQRRRWRGPMPACAGVPQPCFVLGVTNRFDIRSIDATFCRRRCGSCWPVVAGRLWYGYGVSEVSEPTTDPLDKGRACTYTQKPAFCQHIYTKASFLLLLFPSFVFSFPSHPRCSPIPPAANTTSPFLPFPPLTSSVFLWHLSNTQK